MRAYSSSVMLWVFNSAGVMVVGAGIWTVGWGGLDLLVCHGSLLRLSHDERDPLHRKQGSDGRPPDVIGKSR